MKISSHLLWLAALLGSTSLALADGKPKLTLDEFFNSVSYSTVAISPDGNSVVIGTERADWDQKIFRSDLWLYREDAKAGSPNGSSLIQLTQSGHDGEPKWSPDGRWIAFLSDRKASSEKDSDSGDEKESDKEVSQLYRIGRHRRAELVLQVCVEAGLRHLVHRLHVRTERRLLQEADCGRCALGRARGRHRYVESVGRSAARRRVSHQKGDRANLRAQRGADRGDHRRSGVGDLQRLSAKGSR